jgi:hypothetical protein
LVVHLVDPTVDPKVEHLVVQMVDSTVDSKVVYLVASKAEPMAVHLVVH